MKKLAILLLGVLPLVMSSCLKEENDYFDKSASDRLEEAVAKAISVLEGAEHGWAVKYYPNPTQAFGGFNLFFKFADGQVTVCSEIASATKTVTSLYSMGQEAGATLTFDTKNELINYFVHPRNPDGYGSNYKGLEGDYLWTVLSAEPEKVLLRGVKSGSLYTLTPLQTDDWTSEMQAYKNAAGNMKFPSYVCVVKGDSLECITTSEGKFLYRNLTIRQETDKGIKSYAAPFIYTKTGIELYEPLTINGVTAQQLELKEDYYFANEDDSFIISGPKPAVSENTLDYELTTTFNSVKVKATPSNSDKYYVTVLPAWEAEGYTDKELQTMICAGLTSAKLYSGVKTVTFSYLYDEAEYVVLGFGVDPNYMSASTKIFRQSVTTAKLPDAMTDAYKAWLGTWTVTSASSEKSKTSYSFDIVIRPRTQNGTYFIRGWGYTSLKDDYEFYVSYTSSTKSFKIYKRTGIATLDDGGSLQLLPRYQHHTTGAYGLLNTSGVCLEAKPDGDGKGVVTGAEGKLTSGDGYTITSVDFWNVKNGSNYYLTAMDPYTYQDFFVGPYTMVRKSTDYKPSAAKSQRNTSGILQKEAQRPFVTNDHTTSQSGE
ncbi:DUF4302 domain-containing protein [Alistipes sp.]|uniref:DUF4302 domain-containing protein n=1 Tax=Alistipes sp. TaxID=1872444 RepID=UPI003AB754BD